MVMGIADGLDYQLVWHPDIVCGCFLSSFVVGGLFLVVCWSLLLVAVSVYCWLFVNLCLLSLFVYCLFIYLLLLLVVCWLVLVVCWLLLFVGRRSGCYCLLLVVCWLLLFVASIVYCWLFLLVHCY